jgi:DNA-binding response OmpR family regulator
VRETLAEMLRELNYQVLSASCAEEALELHHEHADVIALVLTDLVMPGTGGIALGRTIRERSDVPVLYMSGYSEDVASGKERIAPELLMQKPFDRRTLLERVGATLAAAAPVVRA